MLDAVHHGHGYEEQKELIPLAAELGDDTEIFLDCLVLGHFGLLQGMNLPENVCYLMVKNTLILEC